MKRVALLVALTGCNAIFGLDETVTYDAGHIYEDAVADAPPSCPDPSVVPQFDRELHQAVYADENCYSYQPSDLGIVLANCRDPMTFGLQVREGRVGPISELYPAKGDINDPMNPIYGFAIMPEGTEALVARYDMTSTAYGIWRYEREATGEWNRHELQQGFPAEYTTLSTVSRGPRHRTLIRVNSGIEIHEWAQDEAGIWQDVDKYLPTDLGFSSLYTLDLSGDALRLMEFGIDSTTNQYVVGYSSRESTADRFSPMTKISGLSNTYINDLFFTNDCDRLYFPGFGAVFYVKRLP